MKNTVTAVLILAILGGGIFYLLTKNTGTNNEDSMTGDKNLETFVMSNAGLTFTYRGGESGYVLTRQDPQTVSEDNFLDGVILTPSKDVADMATREGGEGSPTLNLSVFVNTEREAPSTWVTSHPLASNIDLATSPVKESIVGGANAVSYTTDGLYQNQVTVIAHGGYIFVTSGAYLDTTSQTYVDYKPWLDSFTFIASDETTNPPVTTPTGETPTAPAAKIDVKVACESALIYTTFTDGAAADAFVAECIAGEHPEVIERYIKDLGVDGATI